MPGKKHSLAEIGAKLKHAETLISAGRTIADAANEVGVTEVTLQRWRSTYGSGAIDPVKRLSELEAENKRLKRAVTELVLKTLDTAA